MTALRASFLILASFLMIGSVAAEEETLKFRLITRTISDTSIDAPVEGKSVSASQMAGVAVFDDGRLADKQFVVITNNEGAKGTWIGYSIYTFENGDTLQLRFTGGWGEDGVGGDYEVLSGTGAYEGATGVGRFDAVKNSWEKATLWDVTLNIKRGG